MADLDDLLEDLELETQSPPGSRRASKLSPAPKPPTKAGDSYSKAKRDVDDLLDDLDDVLVASLPILQSFRYSMAIADVGHVATRRMTLRTCRASRHLLHRRQPILQVGCTILQVAAVLGRDIGDAAAQSRW